MPKPTEPVDMKLSAADRSEFGMPMEAERSSYSYGLSLRFEKPELEKLEMKRLPNVGDEFEIIARGKVTNVYQSESEGNREDRAVQIQITHCMLK